MEAKRYHYIEYEILRLVLQHSGNLGFSTDLSNLQQCLRPIIPDIGVPETVDALKRLRPKYITLWKWRDHPRGLIVYPDEISDETEFFYHSGFYLQRTPYTDPRLQELAALFPPPEEPEPPKRPIGFTS